MPFAYVIIDWLASRLYLCGEPQYGSSKDII